MKLNYLQTMENVQGRFTDALEQIVSNIFSRFDDFEDVGEELYQNIIDEMIYYDDQWEVIKNYITPEEIGNFSWDDVVMMFYEELKECCVYD